MKLDNPLLIDIVEIYENDSVISNYNILYLDLLLTRINTPFFANRNASLARFLAVPDFGMVWNGFGRVIAVFVLTRFLAVSKQFLPPFLSRV